MVFEYSYANLENAPENIFGFKIHISGTLENYQAIYDIVFPYLNKKKITYKYLAKREEVFYSLSVFESSSELGKLITIYPKPESVKEVLDELYELLPVDLEGVYILSDRAYKDSKILFYRFGLVQNVSTAYVKGIPTLVHEDGSSWRDIPRVYFSLPSWVEDLQEREKLPISKLSETYRLDQLLHESSAGNIYLFWDTVRKLNVVFKESRPHVLSFESVGKRELREYEYTLAQSLWQQGVRCIPRPLDRFDEWINRYFIYEAIEGATLLETCEGLNIKYYSRQDKVLNRELLKKLFGYLKQVLFLVKSFHEQNYILNDIHPENFIVNSLEEVYFIDLENSYQLGKRALIGIESEISPKEWNFLDGKKADYYKVASTFLFLVARLRVKDDGLTELAILEDLLQSYGLKTNLPNFLSYLLSSSVSDLGMEKWLQNLYVEIGDDEYSLPIVNTMVKAPTFLGRCLEKCAVFSNYDSILSDDTIKYSITDRDSQIRALMYSEKNLGIEGLSGVVAILFERGYGTLAKEGLEIILDQLEDTGEGKFLPIGQGFYSPYVSNGLSALIQLLYHMDKKRHKNLILELRKGLFVTFAQREGYYDGMVGLVDTLLLTATYGVTKELLESVDSMLRNSMIYHRYYHTDSTDLYTVLSKYQELLKRI